ncbi:Cytochrome c oxidase subunit 1 [bacterium HR23]|nr:Cytochrome c oxidase subunit 1 [bacterium HR23]
MASASASAGYRVCPVTGLKVFLPTERLIQAVAVSAVVALLIGGIAALFVVLNRWLGPDVVAPSRFYMWIALHGWNMLVFWIVLFEVALLYFASSVLLSTRLVWPRLAWVSLGLMVVGVALTDVAVVRTPQNYLSFQPYVPLQGTPDFYLGPILFTVGSLSALAVFFATIYTAQKEKVVGRSLPLVVYGAAVAAIIAVATLVVGAMAFIPAFLWSLGLVGSVDAFWWKLTYWGFGHPAQQINLAAMITVWYFLAYITVGGVTPSEKVSRLAFVCYLVAINLGSAHHLQTEASGALSVPWKWINTGYLVHLAVLGSMIHAFAVPAAIEIGQRLRGHGQGWFRWLIKAPWGNPAFSSLVLSIALFGFLGGTSGVIYGTEQPNLLWHNTLAVVGHFKGTVVLGTTLAFMGVTWYVLPLIFRRQVVGRPLAVVQPWLFGVGMALLAVAFMKLGVADGVPRKQGDIFLFGGSAFAFPYPAHVWAWMAVAGIGGLLGVLGGAIFVGLVVGTVLMGKRLSEAELKGGYGLPGAVPAPVGGAVHSLPVPKGTLVLTIIFWLFFLAMYLRAFAQLSSTWPLGH